VPPGLGELNSSIRRYAVVTRNRRRYDARRCSRAERSKVTLMVAGTRIRPSVPIRARS